MKLTATWRNPIQRTYTQRLKRETKSYFSLPFATKWRTKPWTTFGFLQKTLYLTTLYNPHLWSVWFSLPTGISTIFVCFKVNLTDAKKEYNFFLILFFWLVVLVNFHYWKSFEYFITFGSLDAKQKVKFSVFTGTCRRQLQFFKYGRIMNCSTSISFSWLIILSVENIKSNKMNNLEKSRKEKKKDVERIVLLGHFKLSLSPGGSAFVAIKTFFTLRVNCKAVKNLLGNQLSIIVYTCTWIVL